MVLASVDPGLSRSNWYTTDGNRSTSLANAAHKQDPADASGGNEPANDPLNPINWPVPSARESFWAQMVADTGATWEEHGLGGWLLRGKAARL